MASKNLIDKETLSQIATGEYSYHETSHARLVDSLLTKKEYTLLFKMACFSAGKILVDTQDPASRIKVGSLFRSEGLTNKLNIDARRYSKPIPMGEYNGDGSELFSRVTVTEHNRRDNPKDRFHSVGIGAVAVELFIRLSKEDELTMHSATCQKNGETIGVEIDTLAIPPAAGMPHIISLLELTRAAIDA